MAMTHTMSIYSNSDIKYTFSDGDIFTQEIKPGSRYRVLVQAYEGDKLNRSSAAELADRLRVSTCTHSEYLKAVGEEPTETTGEDERISIVRR